MIESLIENVSTYGGNIDGLFTLITVIVGFWFILAEAVLFYFIIRYRRKKGVKAQYVTGEKKKEHNWIAYPHYLIILFDIVIIVGAVMVWYKVKQDLPPADETIRVTGRQWAWVFTHPGPDGVLDTADDIEMVDKLHVKVDTLYHFQLESKDVVHSFSVPVFRLKQDAIPGRVITGWFEATKTGEYDIQCAEICGIGHGIMAARISIETAETHQVWMDAHGGSAETRRIAASEKIDQGKAEDNNNG